MKKLIISLFFFVSLIACGTLRVPHYAKSPMTLGDDVLDFSIFGAMDPHIPLKYKEDDADPNPDKLPISDIGLKLRYGMTDTMDIVFFGSAFTIVGLGLGYQWMGKSVYKTKKNNWNSTVQLKYVISRKSGKSIEPPTPTSTDNTVYLREHMEFNLPAVFSLSNSFGYMVNDWFTVYGGGQILYIQTKYKIEDKKGKRSVDKHIWGYGPFGGILLNLIGLGTTNSSWKIIFVAEGSLTNIPVALSWNKGKERHWLPGISSSLSFLIRFPY